MSNKRIKEISGLSKDELLARDRELRAKLFEGKIKNSIGQLEDTGSLWRMRKDLARVQMRLGNLAKVSNTETRGQKS